MSPPSSLTIWRASLIRVRHARNPPTQAMSRAGIHSFGSAFSKFKTCWVLEARRAISSFIRTPETGAFLIRTDLYGVYFFESYLLARGQRSRISSMGIYRDDR